ncbi:serine protease persephone-like [Musca autumnalis]|uniref:serine protease persephone-like n=1 Tax=Musca autumnalis TaxID=221902 RepID=UPI003CF58C60
MGNRRRLSSLLMIIVIMMLLQQLHLVAATAYENDPCISNNVPGICTTWSNCRQLEQLIKSGRYTIYDVGHCGYAVREELICCPSIKERSSITEMPITTATTTTTRSPATIPPTTRPPTTRLHRPRPNLPYADQIEEMWLLKMKNQTQSKIRTSSSNDRPAVKACQRIHAWLKPSLSEHILNGIPASFGEFPHMAAIDYSSGKGILDIRCGGTLIDTRFVLTAAHCVASSDMIPDYVFLGVTDFSNNEELAKATMIKIKQIHVHNDYSALRAYNDIAILELEEPVKFTEFIYPACLYTELIDPKPDVPVWVTGWGSISIDDNRFSEILLKIELTVTPIDKCNASFALDGYMPRIKQGIQNTQLCAKDKKQEKDACHGDSGGPLVLVADESRKSYKVIGVVSAGFSCADITPGLYTRVASYLDFIEQIVWPNGGD